MAEEFNPAEAALTAWLKARHIYGVERGSPGWCEMVKDMASALAAAKPPKRPCPCGGRRWVDDEGWSPPFEKHSGERVPRDGLIPCGFCNFAGWNTPLHSLEEDDE